jgi:predicted nucleic acid-binding Zn finger protein
LKNFYRERRGRSEGKTDELNVFKAICRAVSRSGKIDEENERALKTLLSDRFERALELIHAGAVKRRRFTPSGRVVWIVKGKKALYQVIPHSNFCSCDDFYYRVLDRKKQLCYHLVAQGLAAALKKFEDSTLPDSEYERVISKLRLQTVA